MSFSSSKHGRNKEAKRGGIIAIISYKSLGLSRTQKCHINKSTPMPMLFRSSMQWQQTSFWLIILPRP